MKSASGIMVLAALLSAFVVRAQSVPASVAWWSTRVEQALDQSETNRAQLVKALVATPVPQRNGMQFLIENMPVRDLRALSSEFLLENASLAFEARAQAPWGGRLSDELFYNDVLAYVSVTEPRENWRRILREKALMLAGDATTPGEAAQRINRGLFKMLNVKYSTDRQRADQGPLESMKSGIATCTGLSILLVDACRSVGIPARVVGTPLWANKRGNHTWVEVWDDGWHFTGAAEADPKGLDRGWFVHDASEAKKEISQHAIYASSFKKTGLSFPMVWARRADYVSAENVTDRYTPNAGKTDADKVRLLVKVLDRPAGKRVAANVVVIDAADASIHFEGTSKDESSDLNDILPFTLPRNHRYMVRAEGWQVALRDFEAKTNAQELLVIPLSDTPLVTMPSMFCYVPAAVTGRLRPADEKGLRKELTEYFAAAPAKQATWKFPSRFEKLLRDNEPLVRLTAWEAFKSAPIHSAAKSDFDTNQVRFQQHLSPYTVKTVGTRPVNGWPVFIAMHGGGNTPKAVNDSQWRIMQRYYKDHPEVGGYLYIALRAPNDTWNGFYDVYVYPLVANLINQFLLFGDADPNKIFIMGYSHGGYGAFAIGPKIPDRFAAIHASAGAPTDGETTTLTLRNTPFTHMIGEKDTAYGRIERNQRFKAEIEELRRGRTNEYPVVMQFIPGNGHTGLPDRDKIVDMYPAVRNPAPRNLTWMMTDNVITDFFWLHTESPGKNQRIDTRCADNRVTLTSNTNVMSARVYLDARLVDFKKPVQFEVNGVSFAQKIQPSLRTFCTTLVRRGDPELAFSAEVELVPNSTSLKLDRKNLR